ncbi:putative transcription factor & chromatin remodeling ARID family [Medicago truncatula]|uniref:ARID/bright DNA-binding domain-containing protein n=1 Tax=Medicago truncatula TaxID=3880 RepID=G7KKU6_MEDTR|nr:ARID/bright DNA-binding domain-containing protein [Medicago truncatula]RHN50054.1 putative transcription factor & chromatin remodeling ARID family [Medicago truncatula]
MANGYFLDRLEAETFTEFHGNGGCLVEDRFDSADHVKGKQKSVFSQFFRVYLKENCSKGNVRLVPMILGDGKLLDLYQLFSLVKEKGWYDAISRIGLWDFVIDELGLDIRILALVKLVYEKYTSDFLHKGE